MAKRTFKDKMTLGKGADQVDLYYFGPGHTNGDAVGRLPRRSASCTPRDIFANKGLPLIDGANGGSVLHIHESLTKAYNGIKGVDTIIKWSHAGEYEWADTSRSSRVQSRLPDLGASRAQGRQDPGAGRRRVEAAGDSTRAIRRTWRRSSAAFREGFSGLQDEMKK